MDDFWQRARIAGGEIKDGETRYVVFRADVIASIANGLPKETKRQVLERFQSAVQTNGGRSLKTYLEMIGNEHAALLDTVTDTAASLGWGEWDFSHSPEKLSLSVNNSPFAEFSDHQAEGYCAPILGMFSAVVATLFGDRDIRVAETQCAGKGASNCVFDMLIDIS